MDFLFIFKLDAGTWNLWEKFDLYARYRYLDELWVNIFWSFKKNFLMHTVWFDSLCLVSRKSYTCDNHIYYKIVTSLRRIEGHFYNVFNFDKKYLHDKVPMFLKA